MFKDFNIDNKLHSIDQRAAWLGSDLETRQDWRQDLSVREVQECLDLANAIDEGLSDEMLDKTFRKRMPVFCERLSGIQSSLEFDSGATKLSGFPMDEINSHTCEKIFIAAMRQIGTPVSQSIHGEKVFHVRDEGYQTNDPRARGPSSRNRLTFHSDRCDVIAFLCIRDAQSGGENQLVSSVSLYKRIFHERPDLLQVLMQPFWYQRHNVDQANANAFYQQPVFSFCEGRFASSLLRVLIDRAYASEGTPEMTAGQREALDLIEIMSLDPTMHLEFRQKPGDIVLLNNFVTLHRRKEFTDDERIDYRRHLLRVWLSMPNSRPIDPMFLASYGATGAGEIRGGMRVQAG